MNLDDAFAEYADESLLLATIFTDSGVRHDLDHVLAELGGQATYEAMQDRLPSPKLRPMSEIYADTNRMMSTGVRSIG